MENRQLFTRPPTLANLQDILSVVIDRLATYQVWPVGYSSVHPNYPRSNMTQAGLDTFFSVIEELLVLRIPNSGYSPPLGDR